MLKLSLLLFWSWEELLIYMLGSKDSIVPINNNNNKKKQLKVQVSSLGSFIKGRNCLFLEYWLHFIYYQMSSSSTIIQNQLLKTQQEVDSNNAYQLWETCSSISCKGWPRTPLSTVPKRNEQQREEIFTHTFLLQDRFVLDLFSPLLWSCSQIWKLTSKRLAWSWSHCNGSQPIVSLVFWQQTPHWALLSLCLLLALAEQWLPGCSKHITRYQEMI